MSHRSALLPAALVLLTARCGSGEPPITIGTEQESPAVAHESAGAALRAPYPAPPYGASVGGVIENYRFLGWSRPARVDFDVGRLEPVSLSDFYDPNGDKGFRYIVLTSTAAWCTVCQIEYEDFRSGKAADYGRRGVVFMGALFEDFDSSPAGPDDLVLWARTFDVDFPFVLDPAFKLGAFFDRGATPMTMIIDAHTMQILWLELGWAESGPQSIWAFLDARL